MDFSRSLASQTYAHARAVVRLNPSPSREAGNGTPLRGKSSIKRGGMVGVQVVEYGTDRLGFGIQTDDMAHAVGEFDSRPAFHDRRFAPTPLGFCKLSFELPIAKASRCPDTALVLWKVQVRTPSCGFIYRVI
jgi:hypothetical protein